MTERIHNRLRAVEGWSDRQWQELEERLRIAGLWPVSPEGLEPVAGAVQQHGFQPVEPSQNFREDLRKNLAIAAQSRDSGLVVEYPRPLRELVLFGMGLALIAAGITTAILAYRSRSSRASY